LASLAAAIVVRGGTWLAAAGADAGSFNGASLNGISLKAGAINGISLNGMFNAAKDNAVAAQSFDFNNVAVRTVSWPEVCGTGRLPSERGKAVACSIGTSP
jgi:hypothetical protein